MSWNPLRKLQRNGSKSHILQGDEALLEKNVSNLEQLENSTKQVLKDAKKYGGLILDVSICEKKMSEDLSSSCVCQEEEKLRYLVEEWHTYVSQAANLNDDLVLYTMRTVIEPLKKFQGVFTDTRGALKKRDQAMQECQKATQKVQKLQEKEKTASNLLKLKSARDNLVNLEEDFQSQDKLLKSELPLLYEGRIEYFQPCLEALIKAQVEYSGNCAALLTEAIPSLTTFSHSEIELKEMQNQRFSEIYALSIVGEN